MRLELSRHPDTVCDAALGIAAEVWLPSPATLALRYVLTGEISGLVLPEPEPPALRDGLWRSTCFEAFLRPAAGEAYLEFNFSPQGHWAAYRFTAYRAGMEAASALASPVVETERSERRFELRVRLESPGLQGARLGLSAVIEEAGGRLSYWALAHPPGRPDFHDAAGFAYELPMAAHP